MGNEIEIFDKGTVHCPGWSLGIAFRNNNITTNIKRNEKTLFI